MAFKKQLSRFYFFDAHAVFILSSDFYIINILTKTLHVIINILLLLSFEEIIGLPDWV